MFEIKSILLEGNEEIAELLIKNGANVNFTNDEQTTAIYLAADQGNLHTMFMVIFNFLSMNFLFYYHLDNETIVELLLKNGANPNAPNQTELIPLMRASENGKRFIRRAYTNVSQMSVSAILFNFFKNIF